MAELRVKTAGLRDRHRLRLPRRQIWVGVAAQVALVPAAVLLVARRLWAAAEGAAAADITVLMPQMAVREANPVPLL